MILEKKKEKHSVSPSVQEELEGLPPSPDGHDDECVWWDDVGVEPLVYRCTCGSIHKAWLYERFRLCLAVRLLEGVNDFQPIPYRDIAAALPRLKEGL